MYKLVLEDLIVFLVLKSNYYVCDYCFLDLL